MAIEKLQIRDLRNIEKAELNTEPGINIITGENASGKSSLLEAIHLLLLSKSFRSTKADVVIRHDQEKCQIVSRIRKNQQTQTLGIEKNRKQTIIKYAGEKLASAAQLAKIQPVVLITPESHQLILGGPAKRRALIDWLLFHVEQSYYKNWQTYNKVLKQRNAILRKRRFCEELLVWDEKLVQTGVQLDQQRRKTVEKLVLKLQTKTTEFCTFPVELEYECGWGDQDLCEVIAKGREQDLSVGYTRKGPHRSDLIIKTNGQQAAQVLSRGQTKILSAALEMAKISLLKEETGKTAIILVDDLAAELDQERKERIADMLISMDTQQFITATEQKLLPGKLISETKMFHVEQGCFKEVL